MSTTPIVQPTATAAESREIVVFSHSTLFYWWPVWAVGFLMALMTLIDGHRMALVPSGAAWADGPGDVAVLTAPKKNLPRDSEGNIIPPHLFMAKSKNLGVIYATVLLLTIFISNVPLRGLWSLLTILFILLVVVILALAGWWEPILEKLSLLQVHINAGGYLFISIVLFVIWALT